VNSSAQFDSPHPDRQFPTNFVARVRSVNFTRQVLLGVLFSIFAFHPIFALDPHQHISQYGHTAWRMQDAAFDGVPNAITQTTDGYLWIGTTAGLLRFDGVRFVVWKAPNGQAPQDTRINALLGASDGSLWIGTPSGLSHFQDGKLIDYSPVAVGISSIIEDHAGTIWVARYRIRDEKGPLCRVAGNSLQCYGKADGIPAHYAVGLAEDRLGNLWVGSPVLFRGRPGSFETYFAKELKPFEGNPGVTDIAAGPAGSIWAALQGVGPKLGLQHYADGQWSSYVVPGFDGASAEVHTLLFDRDGSLWAGTQKQGIYRIHDGVAENYRAVDGLSGDTINGFYQDHEGNLWVATEGGLDFFRDTRVVDFSMRDGLSTNATASVVARQDGSVWIGNQGSVDILRNNKFSAMTRGKDLPGETVGALFEDHLGQLWAGVDHGLFLYQNGKFQEIKKPDGTVLADHDAVNAIVEDGQHNIWASTGGDLHHLFRIQDQRVQEEIPLEGLPYAKWLAPDKAAGVWIATTSHQLAHYRAGHLEVMSLPGGGSQRTLSIYRDSDDSVLVATSDGLFRWSAGKFILLGRENGLPCASIFSAIRDDQDSLWLHTQCGIVQIAETELAQWRQQPDREISMRVFDAFDAARPGNACCQPKSSKSPDGKIWFVNGSMLQMVDPGHLYRNNQPPPVHIEELVTDRKVYQAGDGLCLPPLIRDLQIDYTALSFTVPQKVRFRYKLEGHDATWQDPGSRRQAFYSDLRPGNYQFRVIASNNDGVWNEQGAILNFSVAPAWYQTNWFRILCLVAAALLLWMLYRLRVKQMARAMNARFDERLAERTRLARELHDTFLQTIQASKLIADDALEQPSDSVRMHQAVDRLSVWLGQATEEGRAVLNSLRASTTQGNDLVEGLQRATEDCISSGSMQVAFSAIGGPREMHPIVRDEVYRIGYEAIRNACVHSGAKQMEVELVYAEDLTIRVADNGKGIDAQVTAKGKAGHFGLQGMRERAARIGGKLTLDTSATSGTTITLVVPGGIIFRKPAATSLHKLRKLVSGKRRSSELD